MAAGVAPCWPHDQDGQDGRGRAWGDDGEVGWPPTRRFEHRRADDQGEDTRHQNDGRNG